MSQSHPYAFQPHAMYRIAWNTDRRELRGKPVVFLGWKQMQGDIRRAVVALVERDGSLGDRWEFNPHYLINL